MPVPLDGPGWDEVEVAGRPAIAFGDDSGLGALVLRQDADGVTVVGGRISIGRALDLRGGAMTVTEGPSPTPPWPGRPDRGRGLRKAYRDRTVLDGVDLHVGPGRSSACSGPTARGRPPP